MAGYFINPGKMIEIGGLRFDGGFTYVGQELRAADGSNPDPCLINPHLPIARSMPDITGSLMGYFPAYETMKPTSRLAYIQWLAGGRRHPSYDVGYPFLFLFGLERALLVDRLQEKDPDLGNSIIAEIEALLVVYGGNNSFLTYATQLLDLALLEGGCRDPLQFSTRTAIELAIGSAVAKGDEVGAEALFRFALAAERSGPRYIRLCYAEMLDIARGDIDARSTGDLKRHFTSNVAPYAKGASGAHPAIRLQGFPDRVPTLDDNGAFREELRRIAKQTIKNIKPYVEAITLDPRLRQTPNALSLISGGEARPLDPEKVTKRIAPWADDVIPASLMELSKDLPGLFPRRIDIAAMRQAEAKLRKNDLGFIPSAADGHILKADQETKVRVVRLGKAPGQDWQPIERLAALARLIAGTKLTESQFAELAVSIAGEDAASRAAGLYWWQTKRSFKSTALTSILKSVPELARPNTAKQLVKLAILAGLQDDEAMRKTLQKAYKTLSQDPESLWSDLHATMIGGGHPTDREIIDHGRVAEIAAETREAHAILSEIFVEDEIAQDVRRNATTEESAVPEAAGEGSARPQTPANRFPGLKAGFAALLEAFDGRREVPADEFEAGARGLGLMVDGAIDAINDWSLERFDFPLIEPNGNNIQIEWSEIGAALEAA